MLGRGVAELHGYFGSCLLGIKQILFRELQALVGEVAENGIIECLLKAFF